MIVMMTLSSFLLLSMEGPTNPEDVKIKMKTFESLLLDHYTDNLKTTNKSRRDIFHFVSIVENQIFNNCAIIDIGNKSKE